MAFQIGSTLLDACVLAILDEEPTYGYVLTQKVRNVVTLSESALYPVLRRLLKDGHLASYDEPFSGRLRRYYAITEKGKALLDDYRNEWRSHRKNIEDILFGGEEND